MATPYLLLLIVLSVIGNIFLKLSICHVIVNVCMLSNTHRVYCNILKILLQNIRLIDPCLKEPVAITSGHVATMTMMMRPTLQAGMTSEDHPERLMIALEPEAASIYVRKLRLYQLVPEPAYISQPRRERTPDLSMNLDRVSDDEFLPGISVVLSVHCW